MLTFTNNRSGNHNAAFGTRALWANTSGNYNTALGSSPLDHNDTGQYNTSAGAFNLVRSVSGNNNTSTGAYGMQNAISGNNNTSLGYQAGDSILTGNNNTLLGYKANSLGDYTNATALGANAIVDASNKIRFGDTNVTVVEGPVAYSYPSDRRLKENINYNTRLGLDFINRLQPVSYNYIADKTKTRHDGFIAQEVEQVMKDLNIPFSGLKKSDNGPYSLAYSDFVMPLVNAVKELNALNKNQQAQIDALSQKNNALTASIEEIKAELLKLKNSNNQIDSK